MSKYRQWVGRETLNDNQKYEGELTRETAGEARHAPERRLKRLLHVMIRVVLEDLNHSNPALRFVLHLRLAT